MALKIFIIAAIFILSSCRSYPTYKQCDSKWGNEQLGTSSNTICKAGCLMSSVSMALSGCGKGYNPGTLNTWLKGNGGYVSGDLFVWGSVNRLGLSYVGKVANGNIAHELGANSIVILNVHNGGHWVLATGINGNTISVNDPGYSTTSYQISEIVANNSGLYHFVGSSFVGTMIWELEFLLNVNGKREKLMQADGGLIESQ
jgi:hypothetical protein